MNDYAMTYEETLSYFERNSTVYNNLVFEAAKKNEALFKQMIEKYASLEHYGWSMIIAHEDIPIMREHQELIPFLTRSQCKDYACIKVEQEELICCRYVPKDAEVKIGDKISVTGNDETSFGEGTYAYNLSYGNRSIAENKQCLILGGKVDYLICIYSNDIPKSDELLILPTTPITVIDIVHSQSVLDDYIKKANSINNSTATYKDISDPMEPLYFMNPVPIYNELAAAQNEEYYRALCEENNRTMPIHKGLTITASTMFYNLVIPMYPIIIFEDCTFDAVVFGNYPLVAYPLFKHCTFKDCNFSINKTSATVHASVSSNVFSNAFVDCEFLNCLYHYNTEQEGTKCPTPDEVPLIFYLAYSMPDNFNEIFDDVEVINDIPVNNTKLEELGWNT